MKGTGRAPPTPHRWDEARDRGARVPVKRAQVDRAELPARRAGEYEPPDACCNCSTDRRVRPESAPAGLASVNSRPPAWRAFQIAVIFLESRSRSPWARPAESR